MSLDSWQSAVAAARAKQKPLYFVNDRSGGTMEATTTKAAALEYIREQARPHLYICYEQINGNLYEIA